LKKYKIARLFKSAVSFLQHVGQTRYPVGADIGFQHL